MIEVVYRVNEGDWKTSQSWDAFCEQFKHHGVVRATPPLIQPHPSKTVAPRNPELSSNGFDTSAQDILNETGVEVESPSWWAHNHYEISTGPVSNETILAVECYWRA